MARPFNIRSRYGQSEPTGPERFAGTITSGLDAIAAEAEARRSEENEYRRQGGVQVGEAPSIGDRFNAVKRGVGRVFGRGGPPSAFVDTQVPQAPPPLRTTPSAPPPGSFSFNGSPHAMRGMQVQRPAAPSPIANALDQDLSYEVKARSGRRFKFDPLRLPRADAAIKGGLSAQEHRQRMEQTELENKGRKDVATINANQRITTNATTYEQRKEIARIAASSRERAASIVASGRANTAEGRETIQQAILDLREAAMAMQAAGLEATGYENQARALEAKLPTGTNLLVEQSTPAGAARIDSTRRAAAAARDSANAVRQRGAAAARNQLGTKTPSATQLARAARDPEYRQFLIESGYKVP